MLKNTTKSKNPSKIRNLRKRKGLTLEDLSGITGISVSYLSRIEAKSRRLNSDTLGRISAALDCHPAELLDDVLSHQREDSPFRSMNQTAYSGALWKNINEGNPTILDQTMAQFYPMIMGMTNESRAALLRHALTLLISQISRAQTATGADATSLNEAKWDGYSKTQAASPLSVLQELPVYRQTSTETDHNLLIDFANPVRWISRPTELIGISTAFALEISDHSLAPKYRPGDIILVNPNRSVSPGCSSIVMKKDNHILVKEYVQTKEDRVFLKEFSVTEEDVMDKNCLEIANDDLQNMYRIVGTIENAA